MTLSFEELKQEILNNEFWSELRDGRLDIDEFEKLCQAVEQLPQFWVNQNYIDKELALELHRVSTSLWGWVTDPKVPDGAFDKEMWHHAIRFAGLVHTALYPTFIRY